MNVSISEKALSATESDLFTFSVLALYFNALLYPKYTHTSIAWPASSVHLILAKLIGSGSIKPPFLSNMGHKKLMTDDIFLNHQ